MAAGDVISVGIEGAQQSKDLLSRFKWKTAATKWADQIGPKLVDAIKREAPVRSGHLRDSTRVRTEVRGDSVRVVVSADEFYAPYVIHGTPPHMIFPRAAKMLHFQRNGADVFAHRVSHPGTKPNNYPDRAVRKMLGDISAAMAAAVRITNK